MGLGPLVEDLPLTPQWHPLPRHLLPGLATARCPQVSRLLRRLGPGLHELTRGQVVAIDGKTLRRSFDSASDLPALHLVSAWSAENRLVLGEIPVDDKSNEITAVPRLLEILELTGAIVTLDAMGCQKEIAAKVRERGADYVLAVKDNQPHLREDLSDHFDRVLEDEGSLPRTRRHPTKEKNRGRLEHRTYISTPIPKGL